MAVIHALSVTEGHHSAGYIGAPKTLEAVWSLQISVSSSHSLSEPEPQAKRSSHHAVSKSATHADQFIVTVRGFH